MSKRRLLNCVNKMKALDKKFRILSIECEYFSDWCSGPIHSRYCSKKRAKNQATHCAAETCPLADQERNK